MLGEDVRVVVVGAGQAGARAAKSMREAGFRGAITLIGGERHPPYERPLLSKTLLLDPNAAIPFVFDSSIYAENNISLRLDCVVEAIDRKRQTLSLNDGSVLQWDFLLLATGSRVRRLAIEGVTDERIFSLRSLDDSRSIERCLQIGASVALIGGGFVGLEVAASAAARGCHVTVIDAATDLLPRLGCPEASRIVLAHHRRNGIDVRLDTRVVEGDERLLRLTDGSNVAADVLIAGIGVVAETALAERAGLEVSDGIVVNSFGMTSDPRIFAAGDATYHFNALVGRHIRLESWQNANLQATAAGRSLVGARTSYAEIPWLWSDQGDLRLQAAGAPIDVDRNLLRGDPSGADGLAIFQFSAGRLVGGITINRDKEMPLIRRLLAEPSLTLEPEALADTSIALRRFLPAREVA